MSDNLLPLFVPLKQEWYAKFESGEKVWEHRLMRRQWNPDQVRVGRHVTLSCGYGNSRRLYGVITEVVVRPLAKMPEDMSSYPGVAADSQFISFKVKLEALG